MKRIIGIFKIRHEERWAALVAMLYIVALNAMVIAQYIQQFINSSDNYKRLFTRTFHISGFDPLTYAVVSDWDAYYNIYRHPLLAFFWWLPAQLNSGLMALTGYNFVQFIVAFVLVFCAFYAFVFLCRIFRDIIHLPWIDSWLLGALTYSFAFIMLSSCVPDHFILSMFMLILTLYVAGRKMQSKNSLSHWQTILLFFITAGISLNNGIKVLLANLFVNGKRFWHPVNILLVVLLPCAIIWGTARWEWKIYEKPKYAARQQKCAEVDSIRQARIAKAFRDTTRLKDSAAIQARIQRVLNKQVAARQARNNKKPWRKNIGKPIAHGEFSQWTDVTTARWPSIVENLLGESIQLHSDYLLKDNLVSRPVIVKYRFAINYIIEALLVVLFLVGIWCGRRSRFLWLALSFLAFDMLIHVVLGFGINEIYIMSAHWLFVFPIAMGYLFKKVSNGKLHISLRLTVLTIVLFLIAWNGSLFVGYLLN